MNKQVKRICINCEKAIPNFRSQKAKTCSLKCSHDWNHSSVKQRDIKLAGEELSK